MEIFDYLCGKFESLEIGNQKLEIRNWEINTIVNMNLEEKVMSELKEAMKAKDTIAMNAIRGIKSAILLLKTDGSGEEITEEKEIKLLQKMVKQRQDSLNIFEAQNRPDLATIERQELEVLKRFLPAQMSATELEGVIRGIIAETGASSIKDMGKVMGSATKTLAGKADGQTISAMIKQLLGA